MRLTEQNNTGYLTTQKYFPSEEFINKNELESASLLLNKLGKLEDIVENHNIETLEELDCLLSYVKQIKCVEEEYGVDLLTVFKALKNGFYTIREDLGLITDARLVLNHTYPKFEFIRDDSMYFYKLKDFGKTWALDKKDLTKEELNGKI